MKIQATNEKNNCSALAISIITGKPYSEAYAILKSLCKKDSDFTNKALMAEAINLLGFRCRFLVYIERRAIIDAYPGVHKNLKSISTRHPEKFKKAWEGVGDCLLFSGRHVSAYKDGEVQGLAKGCAKKVTEIWRVTKD